MEYKVCGKCGVRKASTEFFSTRSSSSPFADVCKDCVCGDLNVRDMDAVREIAKGMDVPFVEKMWADTVNKVLEKGTENPKSILGRYMRTMNMWQYKEYGYSDSDTLSADWNAKHPEEVEIISPHMEEMARTKGAPLNDNDARIYNDLTPDDIKYLTAKWGSEYLPSEWIQMEDMYNRYEQEYDLNVDRASTLTMMCKTNLKMNQMLSDGNIADYQKLASVLKDLRTTGKFTEAQKVEKTRYLDSVGELVAFCEREGSIIPQYEDPDEFPKDKVDFTIKDLKAYTYNLVANEMGLGGIIETYIKKLEEADREVSIDDMNFVTSNDDADEEFMNDVTALEWQNYLDNGIDDDIEELLRQVNE